MQLTIYINTLPWLFHYLYYGMSNLHKQRTGIEFSPTNGIQNNIIYKSKYAMRRDLVNFLSLFCTDLVKAVPDEHKVSRQFGLGARRGHDCFDCFSFLFFKTPDERQ
jgi:hypothetical protein